MDTYFGVLIILLIILLVQILCLPGKRLAIKKKLKDFPERERQLWRVFDQTPFEKQIATFHLRACKEITSLIMV